MRRRLVRDKAVNYHGLVRHNFNFTDHIARTFQTAAAIAFTQPTTLCDPAVGDGSVIEAAYRIWPAIKMAHLSDLSVLNMQTLQVTVPAQKQIIDAMSAIDSLPERVDTMVLTEILEHLEDPDALVAAARSKADWLVASSPLFEPEHIYNEEHLWSFGKDGYRDMLVAGGWEPFMYTEVSFTDPALYYTFQIWVCK